jgi:hypothetical protein
MYIVLLMSILCCCLAKEYVPRAVGRMLRIRSTDTTSPGRPVQQEYG